MKKLRIEMVDHGSNECPSALDFDVNPPMIPTRGLGPGLLGRTYAAAHRRILHEPMGLLKRLLPEKELILIQSVFHPREQRVSITFG
jgi:hypothetical protein